MSHDEIGIVASSFNEMADVLQIRVTELAAARSEAERANQAKSKFLAAASHDLRQPVQSLVLLMALVERQIAANPEARSTLAMMQKALDGLNSLLTAILDVSRLDAGVEAHPNPSTWPRCCVGSRWNINPKPTRSGSSCGLRRPACGRPPIQASSSAPFAILSRMRSVTPEPAECFSG